MKTVTARATADALGARIASLLTGSWRDEPPALSLAPADLDDLAPALLATGSGGLAWWRLKSSTSVVAEAAGPLRDAFRIQTLDARLHERRLATVAALFNGHRIEWVLAKGWAVARHYAHAGLRPYGDLDVFVAPDDEAAARALLRKRPDEMARVDLHVGVPLLGLPWSKVRDRVETADVNGMTVRILGPEDHLSLLSTHFFFHGAWRPTWLSDVAAFVEALPGGFDWPVLEREGGRSHAFCRATVLLAGGLLGADVGATPWSGSREVLPSWLPAAVLRAWGRGGHYSVTPRIGLTEPSPRTFLSAVRVRWPNPVEATYRWHAPLNGIPRLPFQILDVASRAGRLLGATRRA